MNPQPIPEPGEGREKPSHPPKGSEPVFPVGRDETGATMAEMGRPVPVAYGTVKAPINIVEKIVPLQQDPPAWPASTFVGAGYVVSNGGNAYECTVGGTTAGSGGPTGTGSAITDNAATWKYRQQLPCPLYFQRFAGVICEGQAQAGLNLFWDKEVIPAFSGTLFRAAMELKLGPDAGGQTIPLIFDSIGYQHSVLIAPLNTAIGMPSGTQQETPNIAIELQSVMFGAATADVSPADIVNDLITHARRGAGLPTSRVDASITGTAAGGMRVYCDAAGLRISLLIDTQKSALTWIDSVFRATNCDWLWDGGTFVASPLGDQPLASPVYGATGYVPANAVQFNLTADDFLDKLNPVSFDRREDPACFNTVPVEYINRARGYAKQIEEAPDALDVEKRGGKVSSSTMSLPVIFPDGVRPVMLSQIWTQRSLKVRNTYRFRLSWKYVSLRPGDLVTLTDTVLGLSLVPVRITTFEEAEDGTIQFTAVDYPAAVQAAVPYTPQAGNGYKANEPATLQTAPPLTGVIGTGDVNVKVGPYQLSTAWMRLLKALDGDSVTMGGLGLTWYRGNTDPTLSGGGKPIIGNPDALGDRLHIQGYASTYLKPGTTGGTSVLSGSPISWLRFQWYLTPKVITDNLDALRYLELKFYDTVGTYYGDSLGLFRVPAGDRLYKVPGTITDSGNYYLNMIDIPLSSGNTVALNTTTPFAPAVYLRAVLWNVYGPSDAYDYSFLTNTVGSDAPSGVTIPTQGAPPSGGGGGGSSYCPAPETMIRLASGLLVPAHQLVDGTEVLGFKERDFEHPMVGTVKYASTRTAASRYALALADGRVLRFSKDHRLCSVARGWTPIQHLNRGELLVANTEAPAIVKHVEDDGPGPVVDFAVEGSHTYFTDDVLSHNSKPSIP